jgi:hypothetical protein
MDLMVEWRKLSVPPICERMIGFSVPQNGEVLVISYEGMHLIRLDSAIAVSRPDLLARMSERPFSSSYVRENSVRP